MFLIGDYFVQYLKNKKTLIALAILNLIPSNAALAQSASPERLNEVTRQGMHVMPFDLKQTQHLFTQTDIKKPKCQRGYGGKVVK